MRRVNQREYTAEYFKRYCTGYQEWQESGGEKVEKRLEKTFELGGVKSGMVVVDYGCGRGELVMMAGRKGARAYGFDYSTEAIKFAKKLSQGMKGIRFQLIKESKILAKDKSVDLVFFVDVIEHLYPEEVMVVMKEFRRILKPGGRLVIHTAPNRELYDIGYVYFSRFLNMVANKLFWKKIFKEVLPTKRNCRDEREIKLHINECSGKEVEEFLRQGGFSDFRVWHDSDIRKIRIRDKIRFNLLQPNFGFLKRWFAYDIWAIAQAV
jgi:cyclopropane fatty-acyl-phospholipid synthase-like methyltransferase